MEIDNIQDNENLIRNNTNDVSNSDKNNDNNKIDVEEDDSEDEFGDIDLNEDEINFLMSPQSQKSNNFTMETGTPTKLNFNSTSNSVSNSVSNSNYSIDPNNTSIPIKSSQSTSMYSYSQNLGSSIEDQEFLKNLEIYYENLFPYKQYYNWLSYGNVNKEYFPHREFSFTLISDAYIRFQSFLNEKELKDNMLKYNPKKIDIGAVYNIRPNEKRKYLGVAFKPIEKELVFDIDMTDYDDIRTCCSGGNVCSKCWTFMTIAIKIIHRILTEDFGFEHILWVYSGRRGVHCWVCDERARKLSESARKAIVSYIEVIKGSDQQSKKVNLPTNLHPSLSEAENIVREYFPKLILEDMNIFDKKKEYSKLLDIIPDDEIKAKLSKSWETSDNSPEYKWNELSIEVEGKEKKKKELKNLVRDIIFQYTYPRLDFNVSIHLNHLLKSPFCIHPGTGRVCVPIDPEFCDDFDPLSVPTLNKLIEELSIIKKENINNSPTRVNYLKSTSIAKYMKPFNKFLKSLETEIHQARIIKKELEEQNLEDYLKTE